MDKNYKEKIKEVINKLGFSNYNSIDVTDEYIIINCNMGIRIILDYNFNILNVLNNNNTDISKKLSFPFDNYDVEDIVSISKNIDTEEDIDSNLNISNNDKLLAYIKFLSLELEKYFSLSYKMQSLGYGMPDSSQYLNSIINKINNYIIPDLRMHKRPSSIGLMAELGQKNDYVIFMNYLPHIINLYISNMGLKIDSKDVNNLEYCSEEEKICIDKLSRELLDNYHDGKINDIVLK